MFLSTTQLNYKSIKNIWKIPPNICKLNNILLYNPWSMKNSKGILEFKVNKNKNTSYEYL